MKLHDDLKFRDVAVTREELVAAVKKYNGLQYRASGSWVSCDPSGNLGGWCNCYGVLLLAARDVGLVPADFDVNLSPARWGQAEAKTLWEIINQNFTQVATVAESVTMCAGDVLLMRYRDVDPRLNEPHHVGMCVEESTWGRPSKLLHASQGTGRVVICDLDRLFEQRIAGVWSLNNFTE